MKKIDFKSIFKPKPKPTLGIDIGSHSIKLIEFEEKGGEKILKKIGRTFLPNGAIVDGSIKDHEAVTNALRNLITNVQPKLKRTSTSISGYSVIVKKIHVPLTTEREIEENLIIEAEKYVPFEIEEVYIDFSILKTYEDEPGGTDLFLVAAKKEIVDSYASLLEEVGLIPSVIDVDVFTLSNAFEMAYGIMEEAAVLVDIGATKTNLNIVYKAMPIFTRDMAFGGEQLTDAIRDATGLNWEEAEKVKIGGTEDTILKKEINEVINQLVDLWVQEVKKAIDFFKSNSPQKEHPSHIFLSGGCALLKGIEEKFANGLELEAKRLNCLETVKLSKEIDREYVEKIGPQMAIATGLALRSIE